MTYKVHSRGQVISVYSRPITRHAPVGFDMYNTGAVTWAVSNLRPFDIVLARQNNTFMDAPLWASLSKFRRVIVAVSDAEVTSGIADCATYGLTRLELHIESGPYYADLSAMLTGQSAAFTACQAAGITLITEVAAAWYYRASPPVNNIADFVTNTDIMSIPIHAYQATTDFPTVPHTIFDLTWAERANLPLWGYISVTPTNDADRTQANIIADMTSLQASIPTIAAMPIYYPNSAPKEAIAEGVILEWQTGIQSSVHGRNIDMKRE